MSLGKRPSCGAAPRSETGCEAERLFASISAKRTSYDPLGASLQAMPSTSSSPATQGHPSLSFSATRSGVETVSERRVDERDLDAALALERVHPRDGDLPAGRASQHRTRLVGLRCGDRDAAPSRRAVGTQRVREHGGPGAAFLPRDEEAVVDLDQVRQVALGRRSTGRPPASPGACRRARVARRRCRRCPSWDRRTPRRSGR